MAKKSQISEKKVPEISRRKSSVLCEDDGIFRAYEITCNTSLPSICGLFHLIAKKCVGLFFAHKHWQVKHIIYSFVRYSKLEKSFFGAGHGTITVHCTYTSFKGLIFTEQNGCVSLNLRGYIGLTLPLLFDCW